MSKKPEINWDEIVIDHERNTLQTIIGHIRDERKNIQDYPFNSGIIYRRHLATFIQEYCRQRGIGAKPNTPDEEMTQFIQNVLGDL